jgi:hypothetical protein
MLEQSEQPAERADAGRVVIDARDPKGGVGLAPADEHACDAERAEHPVPSLDDRFADRLLLSRRNHEQSLGSTSHAPRFAADENAGDRDRSSLLGRHGSHASASLSPPTISPRGTDVASAEMMASASAQAMLVTAPDAWFGNVCTARCPSLVTSFARMNSSRPGLRVMLAASGA